MTRRTAAMRLLILLALASCAGPLARADAPRPDVAANESAALDDVRRVLAAQSTFRSLSGGSHGDLDCLVTPEACLDSYDGSGLLAPALVQAGERRGYTRAFHRGPAAARARTFEAFAYTATPVVAGETGERSFCGDSSGRICFDPTGAELVPEQGACPRDCRRLDAPAQEPAAESTPSPAPLRVGGDIPEPRKLKNANPAYPDSAKDARVQGIVVMDCTISAQGRVTDVEVLRSVPLLDEAAVAAVRQWLFAPTLVKGVAVPVIMTVFVNFKLY